MPKLIIEQDAFLRMFGPIIDDSYSRESRHAVADFFAHDVPDLEAWRRRLHARLPGLLPAHVVMVDDRDSLHRELADAAGVIVESLPIGTDELQIAPHLRVVQKYGFITKNIDIAACIKRGVRVEIQRRRVNVAVAEQAFSLIIALSKRINQLDGVVTKTKLEAVGYDIRPYDRKFAGKSNFARIPHLRVLDGATLGLIGMGEIGREVAQRGAAFGMRVLYTQRTRLAPEDELPSHARYCTMDDLLRQSDYVSISLPVTDSTRGIVGAHEFAQIKKGCILVNVARAELIERNALLRAIKDGTLGGAGFDVWYEEPVREDDPILTAGNVLMMPHTAIADRHLALDDIDDLLTKMWRAIALTHH